MPGRCRFRRFIAITAYFAAAALLVKILPPLLLGSRSGLALVDRHDTFVSQRFASALEALGSRFVELVTSNLLQHGLLLSVLFSLPIAILGQLLMGCPTGRGVLDERRKVGVYTLTILLPMVVAVAVYTVSAAYGAAVKPEFLLSHPGESAAVLLAAEAARLHVRYYDCLFPLFLVVLVARLDQPRATPARATRIALAVPIALALGYGWLKGVANWPLSFVDCPEVWGLVQTPSLFHGFALSSLGILMVWVMWERPGILACLLVTTPPGLVGRLDDNPFGTQKIPVAHGVRSGGADG
jgi:phosphoglycerol transferase